VEANSLEAVRFLVSASATPNQKDDGRRAPLHLAVSIVDFLLSQGANFNTVTVEKDSARYFTSQTGFIDMGRLLVSHGELINAKTSGDIEE
jgi:ankyrin repeat protein